MIDPRDIGSAVPRSKLGSNLIVTHRGKHLPAKAVLRLAYCLANNIRPEEQLNLSDGVPAEARELTVAAAAAGFSWPVRSARAIASVKR